jgi:hypothetical protein
MNALLTALATLLASFLGSPVTLTTGVEATPAAIVQPAPVVTRQITPPAVKRPIATTTRRAPVATGALPVTSCPVDSYVLDIAPSVCVAGAPLATIVPPGGTITGLYFGTRNGVTMTFPFVGLWEYRLGVLAPEIRG